ncbi:MAG: hypothetical protein LC798_05110 [Chloroflexi bacterium]|nr:hypothetical protein [Chloroflexota bacterium]
MRRFISIIVVVLLGAALPSVAVAAVPDYQRVIVSRHADAALTTLDGCVLTEVFVSGADAAFGGRPGPVNKQGLSSVLVRRSELCQASASLATVGVHAAGGIGGVVLFDGLGRTLAPLASTVHFDQAWLQTAIPLVNEANGDEVVIGLDLTWDLVGGLERDTGHLHVRVPGEGNVNSHQNTLTGDAVVSGTVTIGSEVLSFEGVDGAHLQQVKYGCQVIAFPAAGDPDLSC